MIRGAPRASVDKSGRLTLSKSLAEKMIGKYWLAVPTKEGIELWPHAKGRMLVLGDHSVSMGAALACTALDLGHGSKLRYAGRLADGRLMLVKEDSQPPCPLRSSEPVQIPRSSNTNPPSPLTNGREEV